MPVLNSEIAIYGKSQLSEADLKNSAPYDFLTLSVQKLVGR